MEIGVDRARAGEGAIRRHGVERVEFGIDCGDSVERLAANLGCG
jgi:hypothetical protein